MRKSTHKSDCNNANSPKYNYKVYRYIRGNDGFENWGFTVLETKHMSGLSKLIRESELITQNNATLNNNRPGAYIKTTHNDIAKKHIIRTKSLNFGAVVSRQIQPMYVSCVVEHIAEETIKSTITAR